MKLKNDLMDGALISLVRSCFSKDKKEETTKLIWKVLQCSELLPDSERKELTERLNQEKTFYAPKCQFCAVHCENRNPYDMEQMWNVSEEVQSIRFLLWCGLKGLSAYGYELSVKGVHIKEADDYMYQTLFLLAEDWGEEDYQPLLAQLGKIRGLLKKAWEDAE